MEICVTMQNLGFLLHQRCSSIVWPYSFRRNASKISSQINGNAYLESSQLLFSFKNAQIACLNMQNGPLLHRSGGRSNTIQCKRSNSEMPTIVIPEGPESSNTNSEMDCIGTGLDVECVIPSSTDDNVEPTNSEVEKLFQKEEVGGLDMILDALLLISPFFFWGTAMVAMKEVLPKAGPFFVAATRLIPSGFLLISFAQFKGRKQPSGLMAWLSIALFGLVDASCFQGFLAEGLKRTSAGLGSVIIDSQPLTVAMLAAILFGESIGTIRATGLLLGVIGLLLLEVPALPGNEISETVTSNSAIVGQSLSTLWGSGEWWMLLAAQSMAVGTVMVRWVCKYSDPIMATGWHMIIGGIPLLALSIIQHDPAFIGNIQELDSSDWLALIYTSIFGSAISYGVYFYNATRGSLTKLSSLTFLTPMFASIFGYIFLNETFSSMQLIGALIIVVAIYMVNSKDSLQTEGEGD